MMVFQYFNLTGIYNIFNGVCKVKIESVKLICTDLDNTLLRQDKTISEYTIGVFKKLKEKGFLTAFSTSRDFRFVTEHISLSFGIIPDILIADNGAIAIYDGQYLYKRIIPAKTVEILINQFDTVRCIATLNSYILTDRYTNDHWSYGKKSTMINNDLYALKDDALYIDGTKEEPLIEISGNLSRVRVVKYSDIDLLTFVHCEATKLNALKAVEEYFNISPENIVAFGDDFSDIETLSHCGYGVAVANAIAEVKSIADEVCLGCNEDGVAKWLMEHILSAQTMY